MIAAPVLAVLLLELSLLLNSDKIGGKANTRQMQPTLGEHSCIYFLHPRVSSASRWPLCVRSLCSCLAFAALPRGWCFVLCQQFSPSLSLHIQDVSFTKQEPAPPTHARPPSLHSLGLHEEGRTYSLCRRRHSTETELVVCPLVLPYMLSS